MLERKREVISESILERWYDIMKEICVTYLLSDEEEQRLKRITEEYKEQDLLLSADKIFQNIMLIGSKYDIDNKLKLHECLLGLRDD